MGSIGVIITTVVIYFIIILAIGYYSWRKAQYTPEDYFMAGRAFGVIALLMGIYATNMSAFGIIGFPAVAYSQGVGALGYAPSAMWGAALALYLFIYRAWLLGKRFGYMTPSEILEARTGSSAAGFVLFLIFTIFTVPYIMTGLVGGGVMFSAMTDGVVPYWLGCFIPFAVVLFYVALGGMRGAVWTNVFQGFVFLFITFGGMFLVFSQLGGVTNIFDSLRAEAPELLQREGNFSFRVWISFFLITFPAVATYPWIYIRTMTARTDKTMKSTVVLYPWIYLLGWFPPILIALAGVIVFPGLTGAEVDDIIPLMMQRFFPPWAAGIALAGILAAMMSTVDAQLLTISTLLTRDVLAKRVGVSAKQQVWYGRLLVVVVATIGFILSLMRPGTIYDIFEVAATGFIGLAPVLFGMLYWRRMNRYGAIASMLVSVILAAFYYFGVLPPEATFGFLPMFPVLVVSAIVMVVVSYLTPPEDEAVNDKFFKIFEKVYGSRSEG